MRVSSAVVLLAAAALVLAVSAAAQPQNRRPTVKVLSMRMLGSSVEARLRVCDDSRRRVVVFARESRVGAAPATRRFRPAQAPRRCRAYTFRWSPAKRFLGRSGYVVTMWARDAGGRTSRRVQTTFLG